MKSLARLVILASMLTLAACNFPAGPSTPSLSANDQAATIVAATMQAAPTTAPPVTTPYASPAAPATTATTKPTISVATDNANCRSGPDANAKSVAKFSLGLTVDLAGKDSADNFWIVVDPGSHTLCWLAAQDGTPNGSTAQVPEVTPPAGSQNAGIPAKPSALFYSFECLGGSQVKVDLKWTDAADNETGYRVYRGGTQIAELPAGSTSYSDTTTVASGVTLVYQVAAYNDAGISPQAETGHGDPITC